MMTLYNSRINRRTGFSYDETMGNRSLRSPNIMSGNEYTSISLETFDISYYTQYVHSNGRHLMTLFWLTNYERHLHVKIYNILMQISVHAIFLLTVNIR